MNPKRSFPRHIIIKMAKIKAKERILKASRGKQLVTCKGAFIGLSADSSVENLKGIKEWHHTF